MISRWSQRPGFLECFKKSTWKILNSGPCMNPLKRVYGNWNIETCNPVHGVPRKKLLFDENQLIARRVSVQFSPSPRNQCWRQRPGFLERFKKSTWKILNSAPCMNPQRRVYGNWNIETWNPVHGVPVKKHCFDKKQRKARRASVEFSPSPRNQCWNRLKQGGLACGFPPPPEINVGIDNPSGVP